MSISSLPASIGFVPTSPERFYVPFPAADMSEKIIRASDVNDVSVVAQQIVSGSLPIANAGVPGFAGLVSFDSVPSDPEEQLSFESLGSFDHAAFRMDGKRILLMPTDRTESVDRSGSFRKVGVVALSRPSLGKVRITSIIFPSRGRDPWGPMPKVPGLPESAQPVRVMNLGINALDFNISEVVDGSVILTERQSFFSVPRKISST